MRCCWRREQREDGAAEAVRAGDGATDQDVPGGRNRNACPDARRGEDGRAEPVRLLGAGDPRPVAAPGLQGRKRRHSLCLPDQPRLFAKHTPQMAGRIEYVLVHTC